MAHIGMCRMVIHMGNSHATTPNSLEKAAGRSGGAAVVYVGGGGVAAPPRRRARRGARTPAQAVSRMPPRAGAAVVDQRNC